MTTWSGERARGNRPGGRDCGRELAQLIIEFGHPGGEQVDPVVAGLQGVQPDRRFRAPADHLVDRRPVLAGQTGEVRPARRDPLQPSRLRVQGVDEAGEIGGHVGQQVARLGQPAGQFGELLIGGRPVERLAGHGDLGERSPGFVVGARDGRERRLGRQPQVVRGLQPQGLGGQRDVLPGFGGHPFDLLQSEAQQIDLPGPGLSLGAQPGQFGRVGPPFGVELPEPAQYDGQVLTGEAIQQLPRPVSGGQALLFGLAVDGDQLLGDRGAHRRRYLSTPDVRPGAAGRGQVPGDDQLVVLQLTARVEHPLPDRRLRHLEHSLHPGPIRAAAYGPGVSPLAQQQAEPRDDHGLAGSGLARSRR